MQITDRPLLLDVGASPGNEKVINEGPNIVYYKTSPSVSSSSFDGSLIPGGDVTFTSSQWLACAPNMRANVAVIQLPPESEEGTPEGVTTVFTPWEGSTEVVQYEPRSAPDGTLILALADRTTRASYDATEETFWEVAGIDVSSLTATDTTLSDRLDVFEALDVISSTDLGVANGVAELDGTGKLKAAQAPDASGVAQAIWVPLPAGEVVSGIQAPLIRIPSDYEQLSVELIAAVAPDGSAIIGDVLAGTDPAALTSVFPSNTKPTVAVSGNASGLATPNTSSGVAGTYLQFELEQIGTQPVGIAEHLGTVGISASATSSVNITRPTDCVAGDIIYLAVRYTSTSKTVPTPADWTVLNSGGTPLTGSSSRFYGFVHKCADAATDPGPWVFATNDATAVDWSCHRIQVRGAHDTDYDDNHNVVLQANSSTWTYSDITTDQNNALEILYRYNNTSTAAVLPSGYTNILSFDGAASTRQVAWRVHATAGVQTGPAVTNTPASTGYKMRLAVRSAGAQAVWTPGEDAGFLVTYVAT